MNTANAALTGEKHFHMHDSPQAEINKMNNILHNEVEVKKQTLTCIGPKELSFLFVCLFEH